MNLSAFIEDSQDLSTIRGGSLLVLHAPDHMTATASQAVSGASHATVLDPGDFSPPSDNLKHATYTIQQAAGNPESEFARINAELISRCRFEQMQAPTLRYPDIVDNCQAACDIDHLRPAVYNAGDDAPKEKRSQSEATRQRREYGRDMRQKFYIDEIERAGLNASGLAELSFPQDFSDLAGSSSDWGSLQDKLALIYADGNHLGAFFANLNSWQSYWTLSRRLRDRYQAGFLHTLLSRAKGDADWINHEGQNRIRLEVLLWGGDEMILAVPAWKGFETLQLLFEQAAAWTLDDHKVSLAAGIVFCHHKAPVHEIKRRAKDLAEVAKQASRTESRFAALVLESFDTTGETFGLDFIRNNYPFAQDNPAASLTLPASAIAGLKDVINKHRSDIPRRQLHQLARVLMGVDRSQAPEIPISKIRAAIDKPDVLPATNDRGRWFYLNELWDYLAPAKPDKSEDEED